MISLLNIKATNFLSHKDLCIDFKKGLFLIDGYNYDENTSNGAGKSAIIDSICFGLYGDLPRKIRLDEITLWGQSNLRVQITFSHNNDSYFIHRERNPNVLNFYKNMELINGKDGRETQQFIDKILGLSLDTFLKSIYFSQNSGMINQFLFSSDDEKKQVLTELLDLFVFDKCLLKVKEDQKKILGKVDELNRDVLYITKQIDEKQSEEKQLRLKSQSFEDIRSSEISTLNQKLHLLQEDRRKVKCTYDKECKDVQSSEKDKDKIEELQQKYDELAEKQLFDCKTKSAQNEREIRLLQEQSIKFQKLVDEGVCPSCHQKVDSNHIADHIKPLRIKIEVLEDENIKLKVIAEQLSFKVDQNKMIKSQIDQLKVSILATENILKSATANYNNMIKQLDQNESYYIQALENKKKEANEYGVLADKYLSIISELNADIEKKKKALENAQKVVDVCKVLVKAFGKEGVKAFVFSRVINEINFYVSQYLREMFDANITLVFDIQSSNSQGEIKQKMDTILTINGERQNINALSGGERARLILATSFALSKIISARCSAVPNFICLDECFTGLDVNGKEKIMDFLRKLSESKDFVFVVDHQTEFQNMFDGIYRVEKRNGISELKVQ